MGRSAACALLRRRRRCGRWTQGILRDLVLDCCARDGAVRSAAPSGGLVAYLVLNRDHLAPNCAGKIRSSMPAATADWRTKLHEKGRRAGAACGVLLAPFPVRRHRQCPARTDRARPRAILRGPAPTPRRRTGAQGAGAACCDLAAAARRDARRARSSSTSTARLPSCGRSPHRRRSRPGDEQLAAHRTVASRMLAHQGARASGGLCTPTPTWRATRRLRRDADSDFDAHAPRPPT